MSGFGNRLLVLVRYAGSDAGEAARKELVREHEELIEALKHNLFAPGFPACTEKCKAQVFSFDEEPRCCCGADEVRFYADKARELIARIEAKP